MLGLCGLAMNCKGNTMLLFVKKLFVLCAIVLVGTQFSVLYQFFKSVPDMFAAKETAEYRFVKLNSHGHAISNEQGPWHCVYDRKLEVAWLVGRDDESPFDSYWSYSWFDEEQHKGVKERGSCYFNKPGCDTRHIQQQAIKRKICNLSNWRLPNAEELIALVQTPTKSNGPFIQSAFFPNIQKGDYWTQTQSNSIDTQALTHLKDGAVAVNFKHGKSRVLPFRNAAHVMLVADKKALPLSPNQSAFLGRKQSIAYSHN